MRTHVPIVSANISHPSNTHILLQSMVSTLDSEIRSTEEAKATAQRQIDEYEVCKLEVVLLLMHIGISKKMHR